MVLMTILARLRMIGLGSDSEFLQARVRTVLDIGCGFGGFGARLLSLKVMAVCIAAYEATGSQVQFALERGLPAMIGNFILRQLPYPSLSFDMVHCAQCGIAWDEKACPLIAKRRELTGEEIVTAMQTIEVFVFVEKADY